MKCKTWKKTPFSNLILLRQKIFKNPPLIKKVPGEGISAARKIVTLPSLKKYLVRDTQ